MSRIETSAVSADITTLSMLAQALGMPLGALIDATSPPEVLALDLELASLWRALPDDQQRLLLQVAREFAGRTG